VLLVAAALPCAWIIAGFYPGRANIDIVVNAREALGKIPYSDWQSPAMSALWWVLLRITGQIGALFAIQVVGVFAAAWLFAVLVHRVTGRRLHSVWALLVPLTPWGISQLNMPWKDVQMAVALLVAVALVFAVRYRPGRLWILLVPAAVLLVYATAVRKNAVFAVIPIAVYLGWLLLRAVAGRLARAVDRPWRRRAGIAVSTLVVLGVIGGGVLTVDGVIDRLEHVRKTGQISQVLLDDVMFSVPDAELMAADAPQELKDHISSARADCLRSGEIWDAYWNCYGRGEGGKAFAPIAHQEELKSLWVQTVLPHPLRYLQYRAAVYSYYLFSSRLEYWPLEWHRDAQRVGLGSGSVTAEHVVRPYVEDFGLGVFPMVFKPWFWLVVGAVLLGLVRRVRTFRAEIVVLVTSSLAYILGYLPIVPANHFRYTYWPALAVSMAVVLFIAAVRSPAGASGLSSPSTSS